MKRRTGPESLLCPSIRLLVSERWEPMPRASCKAAGPGGEGFPKSIPGSVCCFGCMGDLVWIGDSESCSASGHIHSLLDEPKELFNRDGSSSPGTSGNLRPSQQGVFRGSVREVPLCCTGRAWLRASGPVRGGERRPSRRADLGEAVSDVDKAAMTLSRRLRRRSLRLAVPDHGTVRHLGGDVPWFGGGPSQGRLSPKGEGGHPPTTRRCSPKRGSDGRSAFVRSKQLSNGRFRSNSSIFSKLQERILANEVEVFTINEQASSDDRPELVSGIHFVGCGYRSLSRGRS